MLKIFYSGENAKKIEREVQSAFDFVRKIFPIKTPDITIRLHGSRTDLNQQLQKETKDWLVAETSENGEIDILSPKAIERESSHHKNEFLPILKHEFTHIFTGVLAKGKAVPKWLGEGLAAYVAKQHQEIKGSLYLEESFCKKLGASRGWESRINYRAYPIAAQFTAFLIKKYGLEKILKLLADLDKTYYYPSFENKFRAVYGFYIKEVEEMFVTEING